MVPLDIIDQYTLPQIVQVSAPEAAYNYAWASALLDRILEAVRMDCQGHGLEIHWQMFSERVVEPILKNRVPQALSDICKKYGIEHPQKASNMIATVKRRFRTALREHVRTTVLSDGETDDELSAIVSFFSKLAQDFK